MALDLWAGHLDRALTEAEADLLLGFLPPERQKRLVRLRDKLRRKEPLCAYALLRIALRERYGWQELPQMAYSPQGKPYFPQYSEVQFNLSHTDGAVLVAISNQAVGVDIEKIRPIRQQTMEQVANTASEEAFFQTWVRREARTKYRGIGVAGMIREEPPLQNGEYYYPLEIFSGYVAGVATCSKGAPETIRRYTVDEILRHV